MKTILSCFIFSLLTTTSLIAQAEAFGVFVENGKFGLKAEDGSILLEAKYEYIYQHPSSLVYLYFEADKGQSPEKFDPSVHFIQNNNEITILAPKGTSFSVISPDYNKNIKHKYKKWVEVEYLPIQLFDDKYIYFLGLDNLSLLNKKGFQEIKIQDTDKSHWAYKQKNKWGLLSISFDYLEYPFQAKYEDIKSYLVDNEYIAAKSKNKWGIISMSSSKPALNFKYDELALSIYTGRDQELEMASWIPVRQENKWGLFYQDFNQFYKVLAVEYDQIIPLNGTDIQVSKNGKIGILKIEDATSLQEMATGEEGIKTILPLVYDSITKAPDVPKYEADPITFENVLIGYQATELLITHQDGKKGLISSIDYSSKLSPSYNDFDFAFDEKIIITKKDGKYGILQKNDYTEQHPPSLDKIEKTENDNITIYQNGKKGAFNLANMKISLAPIYDDYTLSWYYKNNKAQYYFKVTLDDKKGLVSLPFDNFTLTPEYDEIVYTDFDNLYFCVKKNDKYGIVSNNNKIILPIIYDKIDLWNNEKLIGYVRVQKDNKFGLVKLSSGQLHLPLEWDILNILEQGVLSAQKDGNFASIDISSKAVTFYPKISKKFPLKWKTKIGITTFRTNIMMANGVLLVGSNGETREQVKEDKLDGLFMLSPNDGKIIRQLKPINSGDDDVNGVAVANQRLYFGGDNDQIYCFDFNGNQVWNYQTKGDIEGSPVLFNINGDNIPDAVFAVESPAQVIALDGKTGQKLWTYEATQRGYFMATPTAHDLTGDNIPDVLIGLGGGNRFLAINGQNGQLIWDFTTLSSAGFVNGSAVHASATVLVNQKNEPYIVIAECYGFIHFLNKKGELERYTNAPRGLFSSPTFAANGSFGFGSNWSKAFKVANGGNTDHWKKQENKEYLYIKNEHESTNYTQGPISASPFVADVLGSGQMQFGVADEAGLLYLMNQNGKELSKLSLAAGVEAPIFVKDIDNDGKLEILVACLDGYLYCFDTQSKGKVDWGQFRGNNQNIATLKQNWW